MLGMVNVPLLRAQPPPQDSRLLTVIDASGYPLAMSENDLPTPQSPVFPSSVITYSEPSLKDPLLIATTAGGFELGDSDCGVNEVNNEIGNDSNVASKEMIDSSHNRLSSKEDGILNDLIHPKEQATDRRQNHCRFKETHKDSISAKDYRKSVQNQHRKKRQRHFTDPVDFEGILNIIGGCGMWQIWIPHAMFNLSVVYMMFQPEHWCTIDGLNLTDTSDADHARGWSQSKLSDSDLAYPRDAKVPTQHSRCTYFNRGKSEYHRLLHMQWRDVIGNMTSSNATQPAISTCTHWEYDKSVMQDTIVTQWDLVCDNNFHRADAQLAYSIGFMVGCLVSGLASDRFGRKPTVIGFGVLASMFGIILPYSTYFPMFLLIRFCGAVCNEAADLAAYVLCMEITGKSHRAAVGSLLQVPWAIGYALLALVAYCTGSWRTIQIITAAFHTVTIILVCVLPESPRWLIVNNRVGEAERIIRKASQMNGSLIPPDLELVKHAEQREWVKRNQRANLLHLFKSRVLLMRTLVCYVIWIATALVYYGLIIALADRSSPGQSQFSGNFFVNNAIAGAIEIPTLLGCVLLLRYGRKRCQMGTLLCSGAFIISAMCIKREDATLGPLQFCLMLMGKIFIQAAFNILYIFTSELYPTVIRNSAVGSSSMMARIGAGVCGYVAILNSVTIQEVPMIIFGVFSLVAGVMVLFLPETLNQPLPDTLQDAVIILKGQENKSCLGIGAWANGRSQLKEEKRHNAQHAQHAQNGTVQRRANINTNTQNARAPQDYSRCVESYNSNENDIFAHLEDLQLPDDTAQLPETFSEATISQSSPVKS